MTTRLNHPRESHPRSGQKVTGVQKAYKYLRQAVKESLHTLLIGVNKLSQLQFLEWFNNTVEKLGLSLRDQKEVLALARI